MGIQDRDYMREKRLRWDERSGEMRLDDAAGSRASSSRWRTVAIAGVFAAVVAAAGYGWWRSQPASECGLAGGRSVKPAAAASVELGWAPEGPVLEGRVTKVTDGDSLKVQLASGPIEVRLHAIDAPERDQPGGAEAKAALAGRVDGQLVTLEPVEQDQYGRMVAVVYAGDENVNVWLVWEGHAWAYRQYANDARYCEAEMAARAGQREVWAAAEQHAPWEWRAVQRQRRAGYSDYSGETLERCVAALGKKPAAVAPLPLVQTPQASSTSGCKIKGNIGSSGRIYHVPGTASYEKTRIDEARGERWFCTEDEARAAGWRAPR